ncbi:MAG: NADH-quinone oxidoreductase subunit N [bacterium]|jgi:NADH-quinone oxidoreductase subunit N|nr:NADH-quinone oxidoreductase subunit N [bacterium]
MTFDLTIPSQLLAALTPDLILMAGATLLMVLTALRPEGSASQRGIGKLALVVLVATAVAVVAMIMAGNNVGPGVIAVDRFRWTADLIFIGAAIGTVLLSMEYGDKEHIPQAEVHVLVLFATAGMMTLAAARDLMIVFLGIEIMSIAVYVLAGLNRRSAKAAEGALKYFLLGAFATGFLLYGIALTYGATGSTNLSVIGKVIVDHQLQSQSMLLIGVGLLLVGFGFKVAAVPFHMWAPDVYEGAPTPTTAFMASAVKAAAFAVFLRIWLEAFPQMDRAWILPVWWLAAITMLVGNVVALAQRNIKRLLAYSSVVHSGYLLVAVAAGTRLGSAAFLFYLVAYTIATFGAFAVVTTIGTAGERNQDLSDYEGLWSVRPGLAIAMGVCMLALMGFPLFGGVGFFAKWYLLQAALGSPHNLLPLSVILVLTSVIAAGYYLNVVRVMFMKPRPEGAAEIGPIGPLTQGVLAVTVALIIGLGLFPSQLATWTRGSTPMAPNQTAAQATNK